MGLFLLFLLFFVLCKSNLQIKATENKTGSDNSRRVQSIKTDIEKPFDKSITVDNSNLNVVDFIDQSIEILTRNHRCSFKFIDLSILSFSLGTVYCWHLY